MKRHIIEVHGISAATGWYYEEFGSLEPVLCFALVSVLEAERSYVAPERIVIALGADDTHDLIGMELEKRHSEVKFKPTND